MAQSTNMTEHEIADVILRDGSTLRLTPPSPADADDLVAFFASLSAESRYQRFHGLAALGRDAALSLADPDWVERGTLVGKISGDGEREEIVAVGNYVRLRAVHTAEVAFAVADEMQHRGVGTRLLEQLAARAARHGIERFLAIVRPENRPMLDVLEHTGFSVTRELDGGVIEATFPLEPTAAFEASVDERDHVGVVASLRPFFEPRSVAVIGASPRPGSIGGSVFRNIIHAEFAGAAYPINRGGTPVAGVRAYASLAELPETVELAVIAVGAERVLDAAREALETGTRALCVISAGFAEVGSEGAARQQELLSLVRGHGARLVGPNCLGLASGRVRLNATFAPRAFPAGSIGFSSQSGALGLALLERAAEHGLGFSSFVSIGNKADISSNDLLEWWSADEQTRAAVLYLESFGNPRKFARIARRVARTKPILAMKSGRSSAGVRAAGSHTAALAGSDAAADALFDQAGVIRADTLEELLDVAGLLLSQPLPAGRRVAVLTNAGGLGILCADACAAARLELPALAAGTREALAGFLPEAASLGNPVDMLGSAVGEDYRRAVELLLGDTETDALIVLFVPTADLPPEQVSASIDAALAVGTTAKPVLACLLTSGADDAGPRPRYASFAYPESAARALARATERADWLRRPSGSVRRPEAVDEERARSLVANGEERWLDPSETRSLLEAYGLPLVPERVAATPEEAVAVAVELGLPCVVKTATAGAHKTESGGVALDLESAEAVREAAERIGCPVLVQPMLRGGSAEFLA
ncbi:MAG: GNAT family N-acetyltransferase, partial [Gaiella sp.]